MDAETHTERRAEGTSTREAARAFHELTGFQRDLLVVMSGLDEPSGQTIKMALEERTNTDITHGRLYPNLDTLVNDGFIEKGEIDRRTNYYAISEMGVDALAEYADWMTERGNLSY